VRRRWYSSLGEKGKLQENEDGMKKKCVMVKKYGMNIIQDPLLNKGTCFSHSERDRLGIRGLLPPREFSLETQIMRVLAVYRKLEDAMEKWQFLTAIQDRNETLFYKLVIEYIEEMAPIIYTPTVGLASRLFSHIYRRPRGMYLSIRDRYEMRSIVYNWPQDEVDIVVVTDGSRILGLGDLGVQGMAIPIGKLALYVAIGGMNPSRILPITIDVGTNNKELLKDPLYLGLQQPRITGSPYYDLMDEFMMSLIERWPNVLIQFEDFSNEHARVLLDRYREKYLCFNDDIQGTGAMVLSGIFSSLELQKKKKSELIEQRIVCLGAGSAALGVIDSLYYAMMKEGAEEMKANRNFWLIDEYGLISTSRNERVLSSSELKQKQPIPLLEVIRLVQPHILLGLCGVPNTFTKEIIMEMSKYHDRPIIFPLSNPTDRAECTALNAVQWTDGRVIFASGSPFDPIPLSSNKAYIPSQGNNMHIFPSLGFAASISKAKKVTDSMLYTAALELSKNLNQEELSNNLVYPSIKRIRDISRQISFSVCQQAYLEKLTQEPLLNDSPQSINQLIQQHYWSPEYVPIIYQPRH
jgi:malic enzyme